MDCEGDVIKNDRNKLSTNEDYKQNATISDPQTEVFFYRSNINSLFNLHRTHAKLVKLTIISEQELCSISGIEDIPSLKELWVAECNIQDASPVRKCTQLVKLYLYSNKITTIPDLTASKETLQILWLSGNKISTIQNMENLKTLKELNLGNNNIHHIGSALQNNNNLTTLNLSGNPIYNIMMSLICRMGLVLFCRTQNESQEITDLCHLSNLESLKCLRLADLLYGECPVAQLCNYRPYTVYHLPNLEELDTFSVNKGERQQVEDFYRFKMTFYNNSYQQLLNAYYSELEAKNKENRNVIDEFRESLFTYNLKEIERQKKPEISEEMANEHIRTKLAHLPLKMKKWENVLLEWKSTHEENMKMKKCELNYELKTAGNITFTELTEESELKNACQTLLTQFLCSQTRRKYGISGAEIQKVIQIKNKGLELLWQSLQVNRTKHGRTTFMLLHSPQTANKKTTWPFELCEKGFIAMKEYTLQITDCLSFNDVAWLKQANKKRSLLSALPHEYGTGYHMCLIVKLSSLLTLKRIQKESSNLEQTVDKCNHPASEERCCNIFQVSDPQAVMPLCILEYQYTIENPLEIFKKKMGWTCDVHAAQLSPVSLQTYPVLDETSILKILPENTDFDAVTELMLAGCGIRSLGMLTKYPKITTLNVSCNRLTSISELNSFPNLKHLDISFNSIYSLDNSQDFPQLETLNISWNTIMKFLKCISCLKNHTPSLLNLDVSHNPLDIMEKDHVFYLILQQFPDLEILNGTKIIKSFVKNTTVIDLKNEDLLTRGKVIPQTLQAEKMQLQWKAEICKELYKKYSTNNTETTENDNVLKWISLSGKCIVDIEHPDMLTKTLWADFSHNLLYNVNFLSNGLMLQELSLTHNIIQELGPWLHNLKNLVKLDLSCNYITSLKAFHGSSYPSLKILNISRNWIKNLNGIENCELLEEMYASHNRFIQLNDLYGVQNCKMLKVIDLSNNPIESSRELCRFIAFHLSKLEVLSGSYISANDSIDTHEVFDGCLDEEYFLRYHSVRDHKNMTELSLSNCQIKKISIEGNLLPNLLSMDLQNNKISSLWSFHSFPSLTVLRLSYNHVTQMKPTSVADDEKKHKLFFPNLKTLYLDNNVIINVNALRLGTIKKLEALFIHDNELISISNVQELQALHYLVLDRNKIECIHSEDFSQLTQLKELYLEDNKIQNLHFLRQIKSLERLFIGKNEISVAEELKHLRSLKNLYEIGILGNPMCHKVNYYRAINLYIPNVKLIDGVARI